MKNLSLLYLILLARAGIGGELPDAALTRSIRYGMAWESYWNAAYNDLSPKAMSMLAAQGRAMHVAVWKADTDARDAHSVYYIEPVSHGSNAIPVPDLMIYAQTSKVTAISLGVRGTNAFQDIKDLKVNLPQDFRKEAAQFSPGAIKMLTVLQKGLKGLLAKRTIKGGQHFFVGPFTECSPKVIILWVEQKEFIETGPPNSNDARTLTRQLVEAVYTAVDLTKEAGEDTDKAQAKREELSWTNKWVANCVLDGKLLEVEAQ